jgi:hypothetical protein
VRWRLDNTWLVLIAVGTVTGVALRAWVLASPIGGLDADEAVWGLMARHVLDGELATFFWGQAYGGTQESFLTAVVFALAGAEAMTLRLVPILLFGIAALLIWRVGRRTVGEPAARVAAVLFWVWPSYVVWKSTRAHGFYGVALVLTLLAVLLVLRLREGPRDRDLAALGLVLGLGWWATPQVAFVAAPLLGWLAWRHPPAIRRSWIGLGPALLGAAPWLIWSALHDWASLREPFGDTGGYFDHLRTFFYATWPEALGLRAPFTLEWIPGEIAGRALEVAAVAALVSTAMRRRSLEPLVIVAAAYPFLQAVSPFGSLNDEPRYLVLLIPFIALLLSPLLAARRWTAWSAVVVGTASSVAGLISMGNLEPPVPPVGGVRVPADLAPALEVLGRHNERRVRADYAIAYRITFESGERVVAASTGQVRHRPYQRLVAAARDPAAVFVADSTGERRAASRLTDAGYVRIRAGDWAVYVHRRRPTFAAPTVQRMSSGGTTLKRNRGCCGVTR